MRILQISHAFPPTFGGVESHLWDITHGLARRGHQVACLVGGRRETAKLELAGPTHIAVDRTPELSVSHLLEKRRGLDVRAFAASLYREHRAIVSAAMRKFQPDILHIHNSHHFAPELAAATLECAGGVPVLNGVHDRVGEHIFDEVLSYPWACVVYASRYLADALPSSRPSKVLHLGIDLTLFRADGPRDVALRARLVEQAKRHSRRFSGESYVDALELLYEAQHAGGTGGESRQPKAPRAATRLTSSIISACGTRSTTEPSCPRSY